MSSTKQEIIDQLKAKGIEHDPTANKETLQALLESAPAAPTPPTPPAPPAAPAVPTTPAATSHDDIIVGDPLSLKPVDLPFVVKPAGKVDPSDPLSGWKNKEQAEFAKTLNAHAYQFPESWNAKRDKLVAQLKEIGTNPELFYTLSGIARDPNAPSLKVNDKRFGQGN